MRLGLNITGALCIPTWISGIYLVFTSPKGSTLVDIGFGIALSAISIFALCFYIYARRYVKR